MFKPLHVWSSKETTGNEEKKNYEVKKMIFLRFYNVKLKKIEENKFLSVRLKIFRLCIGPNRPYVGHPYGLKERDKFILIHFFLNNQFNFFFLGNNCLFFINK